METLEIKRPLRFLTSIGICMQFEAHYQSFYLLSWVFATDKFLKKNLKFGVLIQNAHQILNTTISAKKTAGYTRVNTVQFLYFLNAKIPASYYTGQFVSDLVGTQIVGFLTHRLKYKSSLSFYQSGDANVKPPVFIVQANCCLHCHHLTNIIFSDLNRSHYYLKAIINVFIL